MKNEINQPEKGDEQIMSVESENPLVVNDNPLIENVNVLVENINILITSFNLMAECANQLLPNGNLPAEGANQLADNADQPAETLPVLAGNMHLLSEHLHFLAENVNPPPENIQQLAGNTHQLANNIKQLSGNVYQLAVNLLGDPNLPAENANPPEPEEHQNLPAENVNSSIENLLDENQNLPEVNPHGKAQQKNVLNILEKQSESDNEVIFETDIGFKPNIIGESGNIGLESRMKLESDLALKKFGNYDLDQFSEIADDSGCRDPGEEIAKHEQLNERKHDPSHYDYIKKVVLYVAGLVTGAVVGTNWPFKSNRYDTTFEDSTLNNPPEGTELNKSIFFDSTAPNTTAPVNRTSKELQAKAIHIDKTSTGPMLNALEESREANASNSDDKPTTTNSKFDQQANNPLSQLNDATDSVAYPGKRADYHHMWHTPKADGIDYWRTTMAQDISQAEVLQCAEESTENRVELVGKMTDEAVYM